MILTACIWAKIVTAPHNAVRRCTWAVISVVRIEENVIVFLLTDVIHTAGRVYKKVGNDAHARP